MHACHFAEIRCAGDVAADSGSLSAVLPHLDRVAATHFLCVASCLLMQFKVVNVLQDGHWQPCLVDTLHCPVLSVFLSQVLWNGGQIVLYMYSVLGWLVFIDPCTVVGNTTVQLPSLIVGLPGNKMENAVLVVKCKWGLSIEENNILYKWSTS